jgi:hypothetical protein
MQRIYKAKEAAALRERIRAARALKGYRASFRARRIA